MTTRRAFPRVPMVVVLVEAESARFVAARADGTLQEVLLRPRGASGRRAPDWAAVMDVIYQSHMSADNGRHFDAVAQAMAVLTEACDVETVVVAGAEDLVTAFLVHVPAVVRERLAGTVPGTVHDPATALVDRARWVLAHRRPAWMPTYDDRHSGFPCDAVASGTGGSRNG